MDQIGILASVMLAGERFQLMLANWNTWADIGAKAVIRSGAWTASTSRIIQARKIDAAVIEPMRINALGLAGSILGDFPQFCSRAVRAGSMKDQIN